MDESPSRIMHVKSVTFPSLHLPLPQHAPPHEAR